MTTYKFHGNPNGNLSAAQGDQGFDVDTTPVANYFVCNGGTVWNAFNFSSAPSGAWGGLVAAAVEPAYPSSFAVLTDFCDPVRAIMGDFRTPFMFEDTAIASVVRSMVRLNHVTGYGITADGLSLSPAMTNPRDLALLTYWSCRTLLRPEVRSYQWRSRALSERTGEQRDFLRELENLIYYMENPAALTSYQSYFAWVNALAGVNVWSLLTEMKTAGPVASVTLGTGGLQVNTT